MAEDHPIAAHARTLTADAAALAEALERLRALAHRTRAEAASPAWLAATIDAHLTACTIAATDISDAAEQLRIYSSLVRGQGAV